MIEVLAIESLDLPELSPYRTLRRSEEHRQHGIFVAEGEKVVRRLLQSPLQVVSALLPEKWLPVYRTLLESRPERIPVYLADKRLLETLVGFTMYQGVLAIGRVPPPRTLAELLHLSSCPRLWVAADGLANAENLGALMRNCGAFGVQALLVDGNCSSPYLRRAVRSSMGVVFQLPVIEGLHLPDTLAELRGAGMRSFAAHPHTTRQLLSHADLRGDSCLVFGSEGHGLSPATLAACDEALVIPMQDGVDSLNVGSAAAAFLYEASRQRGRA